MQIVIDIDEDYYELIKHDVKNGMDYLPCKLIANGKPLPKGHGKLINADDVKATFQIERVMILPHFIFMMQLKAHKQL